MRWALVVMFAIASNAWFGWNWRPQSDAEVVCDGILLVLFALAITT